MSETHLVPDFGDHDDDVDDSHQDYLDAERDAEMLPDPSEPPEPEQCDRKIAMQGYDPVPCEREAGHGGIHWSNAELAVRKPIPLPKPLGDRLRALVGIGQPVAPGWEHVEVPLVIEFADEADELERRRANFERGARAEHAANVKLAGELDEARSALERYKETFREITDGKPLAEWHAEHCGAVEGAEQMRRERDQARGDLAAQEGIAQELQAVAQVVHTVRTRGGVGELPGVRIERVEDGTTAGMRRMERAEAAVERVRALADEFENPADPAPFGAATAEMIRTALDGGTEADRG